MLTGQRPTARQRRQNKRRARIAAAIAIPVAAAVAVGAAVAASGGSLNIANSSFWHHHHRTFPTPTASVSASGTGTATATTSASPTTSPTTSATASGSASPTTSTTTGTGTGTKVAPANSFAGGPIAAFQLGDVATAPVDGTGAAINLNQTAAQAAASLNCTLTVPNNPLSARGLATPWQLGDGCAMTNAANEGAFVEATILSPGGQLQVYNPLVITAGTTPAATPALPTIARGSVVVIDVGFNGNNLVLQGRGARQGNCVDALGQSLIGQVSACNAVNFYRVADRAIANGALTIPAVGTASDGQPCETSRDFALIDQDQSDNAVAIYLFDPATGQSAQATAANAGAMANATVEQNGSDNGLLDKFVDPALGCTPFTAPNPTNPNGSSASQALNELSARANQKGTIALLPVNNPQLLVGGNFSIGKTNAYRVETDQPRLAATTNTSRNAARYCQNMVNIATPRLKLDAAMETGTASPVPALGNNLATFLAARLSGSFGNLNCQNFGLTDPVTLTTDANGVATAATFNTAQQTAKVTGTTRGARPGRGGGGAGNRGNFMMGRRGHV